MRSASRVAGLLALGAAAACIEPRGYPCEESSQCVLDGKQGRCEPTGFCSYPDSECSSEHRYEAQAGNGLAGACVEPAEGTSTGAASSDGSSSGTGPDVGTPGPCPGGTCGCAAGVSAGALHSCALASDGLLYCWGGNVFGQLGRGTNADAYATPAPVLLPEGLSVQTYSAKEHACALLSDAQVYCWGKNDAGQSDWTDPDTDVLEPRLVEGLDLEPELVAVGYGLSCAAAGTELRCWGSNDGSPAPAAILGTLPAAARSITVGQSHGCGVLADETIRCFGSDARGQLGDGEGETMGGVAEVELPPHDAVTHLAAGRDHTCAVLRIGGSDEVHCWGQNQNGQAGSLPSTSEILPAPQVVSLLEPGNFVDLAVADEHACVVEASGRLFCWGSNLYGMSDPWATMGWSFGAHEVAPPEEELAVVDVAVGLVHTCAQLEDARVWCWGCNAVFQLGPQHDANTCEPAETLLGEVVVPCSEE